MRICFIVSEYFAWGQYGGYGTITRGIAEPLAAMGHQVFALVPQRTPEAKREQPEMADINGVTVIAIPHSYCMRFLKRELYRRPKAEIYVSIDARFDSWMAMRQNPNARHAIWLVDPMSFKTFWSLHNADPRAASILRFAKAKIIFETLAIFGKAAVRRADCLLSQAQYLIDFAPKFFGISRQVRFAPCPLDVSRVKSDKSPTPLVLFLGRFDWQKNPESYFELAHRHPEIQFVAAGVASDPAQDQRLRRKYCSIPNLALPGLVQGEEKEELLSKAWILCNTSRREGLPRSFLEALAHECAILGTVDPDGLCSRFGIHVGESELDRGLMQLLKNDNWKSLGQAGRQYVTSVFGEENAVQKHLELYQSILAESVPS